MYILIAFLHFFFNFQKKKKKKKKPAGSVKHKINLVWPYCPATINFAYLLWSPTASEALSYGLNLKIFHAPRPPWNAMHYIRAHRNYAHRNCARCARRMAAPKTILCMPPPSSIPGSAPDCIYAEKEIFTCFI